MKRWIKVVGGLLLTGILASCGTGDTATNTNAQNDENLNVMTTFYPMYEFTKQVVGEEGNVELLIPAGTDSHDYEPSARDMAKIQNADVFVYNDENMETWVPAIEHTLKEGDVLPIKATEGMLLLPGDGHCHHHDHDDEDHDYEDHDHDDHADDHDHDHDHGDNGHSHELDPHVWLAPNLAMKQVETIRDQLIEAYPEKEEAFTENAASYLEELETLHNTFKETLGQAKQKSFVTQHAAFNYLALEYGLNQVPIAGLSSSEEPSAARIAELKEFVEDHGIEYIYFEENAKDSIARTLATEAGVSLAVLNPLEGLTKEQMDNGETYISIMEANLKALQKTTDTENPLEDTLKPEKEKTVYNGYFEDSEVQDRPLSDWNGIWQTVDTYMADGTFDQVFEYKAKTNPDMTAEEYREYYEIGYKTDVEKIEIKDDTMIFTFKDGEVKESKYRYAGKEILNYSAGNRGVRFLFEAEDPDSGAFKYVQFSDHSIAPTKSDHFHIYLGNESQEALLEEMDNWPTFYPEEMTGKEIAQEMIAH